LHCAEESPIPPHSRAVVQLAPTPPAMH